MKKTAILLILIMWAAIGFSQVAIKPNNFNNTITGTLYFTTYGGSYYLTMSGDTVFVNPWLKTPGLTVTGDIYNFGTLTGDTASFNVLSAASFAIGSLALDSIYLSYGGIQKYYDRNGDLQNVFGLAVDNSIDIYAPFNLVSFNFLADTYHPFIDIGMTSDGDYGDKAGTGIWVGGELLFEPRALNDGTGGIIDGSDYVYLKGLYVSDEHTDQATVTGDTEFASVVPAGYILKYLIAEETAGNAATLDLGTTSGASDVFLNQVFAASTITTVVINKVFSFTSAQSLYVSDDDAGSSWNSGSLNVYFVLEKIIE